MRSGDKGKGIFIIFLFRMCHTLKLKEEIRNEKSDENEEEMRTWL
jgi:hypothetical protein